MNKTPAPRQYTVLERLMTLSVLVEVEASELFGEENINWRYCTARATFQHKDADACEFILHIGNASDTRDSDFEDERQEMINFGCTPEFVELYTAVAYMGALRLLLYV